MEDIGEKLEKQIREALKKQQDQNKKAEAYQDKLMKSKSILSKFLTVNFYTDGLFSEFFSSSNIDLTRRLRISATPFGKIVGVGALVFVGGFFMYKIRKAV